jgi:hypothetical protein
VCHDHAVELDGGRERFEVRARGAAEAPPGPLEARAGETAALVVAEAADCDQIVITGDADSVETCDHVDAFVGKGPVSDEVSGAEEALDRLCPQRGHGRTQRRKVAVDVGEDSVAHRRGHARERLARRTACER